MKYQLLDKPTNANVILLTGVTGYVGSLILSTLLINTSAKVIALLRSGRSEIEALEPVEVECAASGHILSEEHRNRIVFKTLPDRVTDIGNLARSLMEEGIEDVLHCAGCVDYFDTEKLHEGNVVLTMQLLKLAKDIHAKRFIYISTAYSCGYRTTPAAEAILDEPNSDPTEYTRTKRLAERLVGESGMPFLIIRPSIIIGHSQTGRYSGKRYGLYQQWMGLERLMCDRYHEEFHTVGTKEPVNLLHQDMFQSAYLKASQYLPDGAIMNLVSYPQTCPSMQDLWDIWVDVVKPKRAFYYAKLSDVPMSTIHSRQRAYLIFAEKNLEIAAHYWDFESGWLDALQSNGFEYVNTTINSVKLCLVRFVRSSESMKKYLEAHSQTMPSQSEIIDLTNISADKNSEMSLRMESYGSSEV